MGAFDHRANMIFGDRDKAGGHKYNATPCSTVSYGQGRLSANVLKRTLRRSEQLTSQAWVYWDKIQQQPKASNHRPFIT